MTITVAQVAGRMAAVDQAAVKGGRVAVSKAALDAKTIIAAGAPGRLRNVGKGAKLGIRYTVAGAGATTSARLKATGPWPIIESDIGPHLIGPKKKRRRSGPGSGRGGGISIPGVGVRRSAHHPGTKGKHPWAKGVAKAEPVVAKQMNRTTTNMVTAAFRG